MNLPKMKVEALASPPVVPPSSVELMNALFERAVLECGRALDCLANEDHESKRRSIRKVLEIVDALASALDYSVAPELCAHLASLYLFVQDQLEQALLSGPPRTISDPLGILTTLRDAFSEATVNIGGGK
ncbi:MAG: flagellar protein FliS [Deltaproteobacteria bacterium]|nr:flagellar protein FliS [Deltaproteobacteria bacterium]